ncbi:MAG: glycine zipper 2TM domain-containing protein [Nitrospirae bacterium]|nr:glycine zipper 2TM domain-containing protein [Nitrospirota bacterium]
MKKTVALIIILTLLGLSFGCTPYHSQGAGAGAAVGAFSGAIIDSKNPWRGGVIGGLLGAILGATLSDVSYQASREAVMSDRPVEYRTEDGRGVYRADPLEYNERTKCRKVHERVWEEGRLIKDEVREVCEGEKRERRY